MLQQSGHPAKTQPMGARFQGLVFASAALMLAASACRRPAENGFQGYLEGEYVQVACQAAGILESLEVERGDWVTSDQPLFVLESEPEASLARMAEAQLAEAEAALADRSKGRRPSEIAALEAELERLASQAELARQTLRRRESARSTSPGSVAEEDLDESRAQVASLEAQLARQQAELQTARLGAREDEVRRAQQEVEAQRADRSRAVWLLDQKRAVAPADAFVHDTLYREGEFIAAGQPVVVLLPPENIKVRFFVPETVLASLHAGSEVRVHWDGADRIYSATIRYISTRAEFTPPVIYSQQTRAKLVYLVEAFFAPADVHGLKAGQPVDVTLPESGHG